MAQGNSDQSIAVTSDGTPKILDLGLTSLAPEAISSPDAVSPRSDLTAVGAIMGTPDFISPEQAKDARQVDIRSDMYSLGATLYYMLSGRVPFEDGSVMHKLQSHAQLDPAPLDAVRAKVPEGLERYLNDVETKLEELDRLLITVPEAGTLIGSNAISGAFDPGRGCASLSGVMPHAPNAFRFKAICIK